MGEVFSDPDSGLELSAGVGEAAQAALTFIRAADQITYFYLQLGDDVCLAYQGDGRRRLG